MKRTKRQRLAKVLLLSSKQDDQFILFITGVSPEFLAQCKDEIREEMAEDIRRIHCISQ